MPSALTLYLTEADQAKLNRIGRMYGCCRCGSTDPRTGSGNFVGDFHPPRSIAVPDKVLPVCLACSRLLGVELKRFQLRRLTQTRPLPDGAVAARLIVNQEYQCLYLAGDLDNADIPFDLDRGGLAANNDSVTCRAVTGRRERRRWSWASRACFPFPHPPQTMRGRFPRRDEWSSWKAPK